MAPNYLNTKASYEKAKFVVVPIPYEATTSYGKGTKNGPRAIIDASFQIETFDEELLIETKDKVGIHSLGYQNIRRSGDQVRKILKDGKIPIILGGEHTISVSNVRACKEFCKDLAVLQLDAHVDLRESYQGSKLSHACTMRRILEFCPAVQAGIRNFAEEEYEYAKKTKQLEKIHFADDLILNLRSETEKIIAQLPDNIYISIDVDAFDPAFVPATGTPEPGGLDWHQVLHILREVCKKKKVIGFDVVELMPIKGHVASDFLAAKLIYRIIGYLTVGK